MPNYTDTRLWKISLGKETETDTGEERNPFERLRNTYFTFRERAAHIAGEVAISLPEFTVHDVTHLDALWEMADLIAGPDYHLTPTEAFVLGGAFLIHDLGNGLAAYPKGKEELRQDSAWADTVAILLKRELGRAPTLEEIQQPNKDIEIEAIGQVLRNLHAKHAERLARTSWKDRENDEEYHLIEDIDLRRTYGRIIGKIAHSHWWDVDSLGKTFTIILNPPPGFPREWTVDPLKIACLLRVADASHLDTRRAPGFLRALRKPSDYSRTHWLFQENLQQPSLDGDRLVYTSGEHFTIEDAPAWWLCFDTLQMVDRELKQVDALLADSGRSRFSARGVAGADEPDRLVKLIPTDNWLPIDTKIRVSNVTSLVNDLGGEQLYGQNKTVPLRELIQNAADAIRARRIVDKRAADYGEIIVKLGRDSEGYWIEVEDNGVGMSTAVLTGPFLDFGTSFWGSPLMLREFPGLAAKGFESTGRYGIGFFSVFMWGARVRVSTRPYKEALHSTQILEFNSGLSSRPILRVAEEHEFIRDGGSIVRIWLKEDPLSFKGVLFSGDYENQQTLGEVCEWLCPSLDVNLYVERESERPKLVIAAFDWITLDGQALLKRLSEPLIRGRNRQVRSKRNKYIPEDRFLDSILEPLSKNLRLIHDVSGSVIGRACIVPRGSNDFPTYSGVVSVGGFRSCQLSGIAGVLEGSAVRAARDVARPSVDSGRLAEWASEQSGLVNGAITDPALAIECADYIRRCGGYTGQLPIAFSSRGWMNFEDISNWNDLPDEVYLLQDAALSLERRKHKEFYLNENILAVNVGSVGVIQTGSMNVHSYIRWPQIEGGALGFHSETLAGAAIEALAHAWSSTVEEVLKVSILGTDDDTENVREVGIGDGKVIKLDVYIIRNPNKAHN
jgi:hypothetical protein